jgi:enoyl-CoA hydratase/carnithine racemase
MTEFETLELDRRGRVLTMAFNRPVKLNAFDGATHREFRQVPPARVSEQGRAPA